MLEFLSLAQSVAPESQSFFDSIQSLFSNGLILIFAVFFFGFCVFIHELGHFLAAKACGLHVSAFAIGFRAFWQKKYKGVDYRIGWLPFGGYCEIPQVDSSDDVPHDPEGNELPKAKPLARIITAFAGPLFNILFGLALGSVIWVYGLPDIQPQMDRVTVQHLNEKSPEYAAGLRDGDIITKVNSQAFYGEWNEFVKRILYHDGLITFDVTKPDGSQAVISYTPIANTEFKQVKGEDLAYPFFSAMDPAVCYPVSDSPAATAGILDGDEIIALQVENMPKKRITDRTDLFTELRLLNKTDSSLAVNVWVRRKSKDMETPFLVQAQRANHVSIIDFLAQFSTVELPLVKFKSNTDPQGPFKNNDLIISIAGKKIESYKQVRNSFLNIVDSQENIPIEVVVLRDKKALVLNVLPLQAKLYAGNCRYTIDYKTMGYYTLKHADYNEVGYFDLTDQMKDSFYQKMPVGAQLTFDVLHTTKDGRLVWQENRTFDARTPYYIGVSFAYMRYPTPLAQLYDTVAMTLKTFDRLFNPKSNIHVKNMSGPLGILTVIHKVSQRSYIYALNLIVMITFSLGLLNLLPIPILDGGHIVLACGEIVTGRKIPSKFLQPVMTVFALFLICFMVYVTYFDGKRLYKDIVGDEDLSQPFETVVIAPKK